MVKYIGSKRLLVPLIERIVGRLPVASACDLFAGTTRVGQALRRRGLRVHSNDLATYSEVLGLAYLTVDGRDEGLVAAAESVIGELNALPGEPGYFTETFCCHARYFQPRNGARIDAIRARIEALDLEPPLRAVVLTALLEAADRVDSTTGLQMAYLKSWAPRAGNRLELRLPELLTGPAGEVTRLDANLLGPLLDGTDLAYLDPPYNQHSYFSNYHVWETLVRNDAPQAYGVACKRVDCRTTKSAYNSRRAARGALADLIARVRARWLLVSFNDEGFLEREEIEAMLRERGHVAVRPVEHRRYVGARIGIHNPAGERVGEVSHLRNRELLFLAGPDPAVVASALAAEAPTLPKAA